MKKFIIPSLLVLFAVGMSQREAKAGFSIGVSIGDSPRPSYQGGVVISQPPVVVARPPVIVAPPVCEPAPVYVPEYYRVPVRRYDPRWDHRRYDRHENWRDDRRDHRDWHGR